MYCQKCGKQLIGNEKFCIECGQPIQRNRIYAEKVPVRKKSKLISLVLSIAAGIVATSLLGYYSLCSNFLAANEETLWWAVNGTYTAKYGYSGYVIPFSGFSDIKVKIKGTEAIITGKYPKPSGSGEFIAYYVDIFDYFPDLNVLCDRVTLIDSGVGD